MHGVTLSKQGMAWLAQRYVARGSLRQRACLMQMRYYLEAAFGYEMMKICSGYDAAVIGTSYNGVHMYGIEPSHQHHTL